MTLSSQDNSGTGTSLRTRRPTFCIIIAVYNGVAFLQRCIDSVISQTFNDYELIIIDGLSTDGTVDLIRQNAAMIDYWESSRDSGIYDAWNKALQHARGEWCYFLGADDAFATEHVLEQVTAHIPVGESPSLILYGQVQSIGPNDVPLEIVGKEWAQVRKKAFQVMSIPHQGVFQHISLFEKHGQFDASFKVAGDFDFLLRELKINPPIFMSGLVVAKWQIGGVSSSGRMAEIAFDEFLLARRKNQISGIPFLLHWNRAKMRCRRFIQKTFGSSVEAGVADVYRRLTRRKKIWTKAPLPPT